MLLEKIALGKTLDIYVDREGYRYRLVSKVEDATARRICVSLIAANGRVFQFHPEDDIRIVWRNGEQMWEWPKVKAGIAKLDDEPVHFFEITNPGKSFNRRNAYRVSVNEEIDLGFYTMPGLGKKLSEKPVETKKLEDGNIQIIELNVHPERVRGFIKDVSETGIGIYSNHEFNIEDSLFFDIPSPYGMLGVRAEIIRKDELRSITHKYSNYYGCIFVQTDKRLLRYIYDIQREMLKKQKKQQELEMVRRRR